MDDSNQIILRQLLKANRVNFGLKQTDIAKRLNKPQSYVSKYESGEKTLTYNEVHYICKALGISFIKFAEIYENTISASE